MYLGMHSVYGSTVKLDMFYSALYMKDTGACDTCMFIYLSGTVRLFNVSIKAFCFELCFFD